jgi:predicted RNA polymerase sigma factor
MALSISPEAGLHEIELLGVALKGYPHFHAARAKLLGQVGRREDAKQAIEVALGLTLNAADRAHLEVELRRL